MEQKLARMEANYKAEIEALKAVRRPLGTGWGMCRVVPGMRLTTGMRHTTLSSAGAACTAYFLHMPATQPPCLQGGATAGAAAALTAEAVREKDSKINELIEELGNKELLLSEAQSQLAAVSRRCRQGGITVGTSRGCTDFVLAAWLRCIFHPFADPTICLLPSLQTSTFRKELEELREMKEDVERREKAQAEVISQQVRCWGRGALVGGMGWPQGRMRCWVGQMAAGIGTPPTTANAASAPHAASTQPSHITLPAQAKRLEELDSLYRDEAIMRKKIFNQVRQRLWMVGAAVEGSGWGVLSLCSGCRAKGMHDNLTHTGGCPTPPTCPPTLPPAPRWRT